MVTAVYDTMGDVHLPTGDYSREKTTAFLPWDNPDDIITVEMLQSVMTLVYFIRIILPLFLGIPGNVLNALVFYRQGLQERINFCLFSLAIVDLVFNLVYFLRSCEAQVRQYFFPNAWLLSTNLAGLIGLLPTSQLLSAMIASERCFCCVSPLRARKLRGTSVMAAIIVVCGVLLTGGFIVVVGTRYTVCSEYDPDMNTTKTYLYVTQFYLDNRLIFDIFDVFIYATVLPAFFLTVIIVTTVIVSFKLHAAVQWRTSLTPTTSDNHSSKRQGNLISKEVAVTRMLIGTSILFIVCLAPTLTFQTASFLVADLSYTGRYYRLYSLLWALIGLFRTANSSFNLIVYYVMGSKFRETLHATGFCLCKQHYVGPAAIITKHVTRVTDPVTIHNDHQPIFLTKNIEQK